jgi:hypothetical protein
MRTPAGARVDQPVVVGQAPGSFVQNDAAEPERPAPPVVDVPVPVPVDVSVGLVVTVVLGAAPPVVLVGVVLVAPVAVLTPGVAVSVWLVEVATPVLPVTGVLEVVAVEDVLPALVWVVAVAADGAASPVVGTVKTGAPAEFELSPPPPQPATRVAAQIEATHIAATRERPWQTMLKPRDMRSG